MSSINEVINANNLYEEKTEQLSKLRNKTKLINNELDLDEVKNTLNYTKAKEIYQKVSYSMDDKDKRILFRKIIEDKKINEYPEILDVHYYAIIKQIDFLNNDEKVNLDIQIKEAYNERRNIEGLLNLEPRILDFLIKNKILEKQYIFHCDCNDNECGDKIISQEKFDKLKNYWYKESEGIETTKEEDKEMWYGCFETGCWNDGSVEIYSLETFNENLRRIEYDVIQKPDMTLDNI